MLYCLFAFFPVHWDKGTLSKHSSEHKVPQADWWWAIVYDACPDRDSVSVHDVNYPSVKRLTWGFSSPTVTLALGFYLPEGNVAKTDARKSEKLQMQKFIFPFVGIFGLLPWTLFSPCQREKREGSSATFAFNFPC